MYKLRIKIFLAIVGAVMLGLGVKLCHLQVINGHDYRLQAEEAMRATEILPVMRGKITDRRGRILAIDEPCFHFCLDYRFLTNDPAWVRRQKRLIARTELISSDAAAELYDQRAAHTMDVARELARQGQVDLDARVQRIIDRVAAIRRIVNLNRLVDLDVREERQAHPVITELDEVAALKLRADVSQMIGAEVRPSHRRWYPYGSRACHVIGDTGPASREEMDRLNLRADQAIWLDRMRTNYLPGDTIGKTGVSKACETFLRGQRGYRRFRLSGETLREEPSVQGGDVHLTIDIELQDSLEKIFVEHGYTGAAVVLTIGSREAPSCETLALVSAPTYDLNTYRQKFKELVADRVRLPLLHRAVSHRYQPGSTIKPIVALSALGEGAIVTTTEINCRGYLYNPDSFRCWIYKRAHVGHGYLEVTGALKNSCNVFFYELGNRLGAARMCTWLEAFGFADVPGTGLPNEVSGTVPTPQWLARHYQRSYRPGDARFMAVGQGLLTATPLHLANAMAAIARDGVFLSPTLMLEAGPKQVRRDLPLDGEHLRAVRKGLYQVVNVPGGTAYKYFHGPGVPTLEGIELAGKTGTATTAPQRIDSNDNGRIDRDDDIVREGDTAWFVGYAPHDNPRIAFAVAIEYVQTGGGATAGPIAAELVRICQALGYVR